ncbi:terminase [Actinomadura sp. KC345]|uniref:phage terminase large subunit n=1 Tax=Actinomadura sp. KC345 TaxID=2530371 RepID=UPI00104CF48B|nr:phage terminase large subunit [Actinomadura sp. KC345]TDC47650.1 terminase [Actinomadura sp. KC345]
MIKAPALVRYAPRGAARELFSVRDDEVLLDGPAGTGKSLAALYRLHLAALKHPGMKALIVRKTAVSLGSTTLRTFDEKVAADALARGVVRWYGGSRREPACYKYSNGSRIVVGGMDQPVKIMSSEYDLAFCDEATELAVDDLEAITTRLRNGVLPWQQLIAACNPAHRAHWLNQRAASGAMRRLVSRHRDNPRYVNADGTPTEEGAAYLAKLDALTGVRRLRLRDGIWAAAEGVIYDGYDEAVHVVDRFDIPDDWTRWWTVDFGFTNPFVWQCWAQDGDGRLYLYREIYMTGRLVEDHARQILRLVTEPVPGVEQIEGEEPVDAVAHGRRRWTEPPPRRVICDHDAEGRATLVKHLGISTKAANKKVSEGIQAVQARYKIPDDGRPRLVFLRDSLVERDESLADAAKPTCTVEEIGGYTWAIKPGGAVKEEPVKEDDHGQDGVRYMVAEVDLGSRPNIRWLGS